MRTWKPERLGRRAEPKKCMFCGLTIWPGSEYGIIKSRANGKRYFCPACARDVLGATEEEKVNGD